MDEKKSTPNKKKSTPNKQGLKIVTPPETVDGWAVAFAAGKSITAIAREAGVSRTTVRNRLRAREVHLSPATEVSDEEIEGWKIDRMAGLSISAIARKSNRDRGTVASRLTKAGVHTGRILKMRTASAPRKIEPTSTQLEEWSRRYAEGESILQIAQTAGMSDTTLRTKLQAVGVRFRTRVAQTVLPALPKPASAFDRAKLLTTLKYGGTTAYRLELRYGVSRNEIDRELRSAMEEGVVVRADREDLFERKVASYAPEYWLPELYEREKAVRRELRDLTRELESGVPLSRQREIAARLRELDPPHGTCYR